MNSSHLPCIFFLFVIVAFHSCSIDRLQRFMHVLHTLRAHVRLLAYIPAHSAHICATRPTSTRFACRRSVALLRNRTTSGFQQDPILNLGQRKAEIVKKKPSSCSRKVSFPLYPRCFGSSCSGGLTRVTNTNTVRPPRLRLAWPSPSVHCTANRTSPSSFS